MIENIIALLAVPAIFVVVATIIGAIANARDNK